MLLATQRTIRSGIRKLAVNTSSCIAGPFGIRVLVLHVHGLVSLDGGHGTGSLVSPRPDRVTVASLSRGLIRGTVGCIRTGVNQYSLSMRRLDQKLNVDQMRLCGGLLRVANGAPVRFVHIVHLGETTRVLHRDRRGMSRVTCRLNFGGPGCFDGCFGSRFNILPSICRRERNEWRGVPLARACYLLKWSGTPFYFGVKRAHF